jgi:type I restriction enzyme M protein
MQDDVYLIVQDGWQSGGHLRELVARKGQKQRETPDLKIGRKKYKADLIPPALIVARYFAEEQAAIEALLAQEEQLNQELEALLEEHGGEDGLLEEAKSEAGNVTKTAVTARLRELKKETDGDEAELALLAQVEQLMAEAATVGKEIKAAQAALEQQVAAHYARLSVERRLSGWWWPISGWWCWKRPFTTKLSGPSRRWWRG